MTVTFVCTGGTCRSPMLKYMAESYFRNIGEKGIVAECAGIEDYVGDISRNAASVLREHGADIKDLKTQNFSRELFERSDYIFTMCAEHRYFVDSRFGGGKSIPLSVFNGGEDISDPYGGDIEAYLSLYETFEKILPEIYNFLKLNQKTHIQSSALI